MAGLNVILVDYLLQPTLFYLRTILSVHFLLLLFFFSPKNSLYVPSDVYDVAESGTRLTKSKHSTVSDSKSILSAVRMDKLVCLLRSLPFKK